METWILLALVAAAASTAVRTFDRHRRRTREALAHVEAVSRDADVERVRLDMLEYAIEEYVTRQKNQGGQCRTRHHSS